MLEFRVYLIQMALQGYCSYINQLFQRVDILQKKYNSQGHQNNNNKEQFQANKLTQIKDTLNEKIDSPIIQIKADHNNNKNNHYQDIQSSIKAIQVDLFKNYKKTYQKIDSLQNTHKAIPKLLDDNISLVTQSNQIDEKLKKLIKNQFVLLNAQNQKRINRNKEQFQKLKNTFQQLDRTDCMLVKYLKQNIQQIQTFKHSFPSNRTQITQKVQKQEKLISLLFEKLKIDKQNDQMPKRLQKIIKNLKFDKINEQLNQNKIYQKLTHKQIKQIKQNKKNVNLSTNPYKLTFDRMQINFVSLIHSRFIQIEYLQFFNVKINQIELQLLILNLNHVFPNLKIIQFISCSLNDQHWKIIIQNVHKLENIQVICLKFNQITKITYSDLQSLQTIKQLKYIDLRGLITDQRVVLEQYKKSKKHIMVLF